MNNSFTLPPAVLRLLIVLAVIQLIRTALPPDLDAMLVYYLGFDLFRSGGFDPMWLYGAVTSVFVHGGWWHLLANAMWIFVISPQIFPHIGGRRFVWFFILTGVAGALAHAALNWGESAILVGASGAVFGLLGAGAFVLIRGQDGFSKPSGKDILQYVLMMMIIVNVGYAVLSGGNVSWEAHAGGFFAGMALFPFMRLRPPGNDTHLRVVN
ncbi:MAG: rhomboid family intramembrane serine protease [Alphaproteobacteria bacterium]